MIDLYRVGFGLAAALMATPRIAGHIESRKIKVNSPVNADPDNLGWVGIYLSRDNIDPSSLPRVWGHEMTLTIVTQEGHATDPEKAAAKLSQLNGYIIESLIKDSSVKSMIDAITRLTVDYSFDQGDEASRHFTISTIDVTLVVKDRSALNEE